MNGFQIAIVTMVLGVFSLPADAAMIVFGNQELQPDMAGQDVWLSVTGGESVGGMELRMQIGDGGPTLGGSDDPADFPAFQAADLVTDTIFAGGTQVEAHPMEPLVLGENVAVSNNVAASGQIVRLIFDTTGISSGVYPVSLSWTLQPSGQMEPTRFGSVDADLTDGTITIVPEPANWLLVLVGCTWLIGYRRN